jgi:hypothetical protein
MGSRDYRHPDDDGQPQQGLVAAHSAACYIASRQKRDDFSEYE